MFTTIYANVEWLDESEKSKNVLTYYRDGPIAKTRHFTDCELDCECYFIFQSNPKSDEGSDSPHSRNVIADGENFTVTVGAGGRRDSPRDRSPPPPSSKRKVTASRGRSRSRSKSPAVQAKKKSIKERLGPVSDTEKPTFKNEHWNGKPKIGKNERNGGGRDQQRASSKDRKRDRDS